jgi:membrane-bound lytic murein transglycosylase D
MVMKQKATKTLLVSLLMGTLSACATFETRVDLPEQASALGPEQAVTQALDSALAEDYDIWERVRNGFTLDGYDHPGVESDIRWYARHQKYLDRVAERAENYLFFVLEEVEKRDMPNEIALLPIVESAYHPFAYSHGRAAGIWQFIPSTGRRYGMQQNWWYDGRRDIYASTVGALNYLNDLQRRFDGDWLLALAAYNSGEGTVRSAMRKSRRHGKGTDFWSIRRYLPKETRGYVPKLLAISSIVADPESQGVSLLSIPDQPYITRVEIDSQIDLALVSDLAELSLEEVYRLNPGFNRWATSPTGPHYLMLPLDNAAVFQTNLESVPEQERVHWKRYRVRSGDSLLSIAERHHTTVGQLKKVNRIRGNTIRAGSHLIIPIASQSYSSYQLTADARLRRNQQRPRIGNKVVYTVRAGDTLWDLARYHKVSVNKLAKWNSMAPRDPLVEGQRIVIWSKLEKTAMVDPRNFRIPIEGATTRRIRYAVRQGDSLARISQKFRVSVSQLLRWNRKLSTENVLRPGQRITLYVDITRQSG